MLRFALLCCAGRRAGALGFAGWKTPLLVCLAAVGFGASGAEAQTTWTVNTARGNAGASQGGTGSGSGFGAGLLVRQATASAVVQDAAFQNCSSVGGAGNGYDGLDGGGGGFACPGGFNGGDGLSFHGNRGVSAVPVGRIHGGGPGSRVDGGGAAAGPPVFFVHGSVAFYSAGGSGFSATPRGPGIGAPADGTPVFNYAGTVNRSAVMGPIANAVTLSQPVGQTSAVQTGTLTFTSAGTASAINVLTQGAPNLDFQLANPNGGTCDTVTAHSVGDTCTVQYTVTPMHPGARYGAITLTNGSRLLGSTLVSAVGTGPQVVFPGNSTGNTLGSGFNLPTGVGVDSAGNIYVGDYGNGIVQEIAANCASGNSSCVQTLGGGFDRPTGAAVDGAGNVYVADTEQSAIYEMPPNCTSASCVTQLGSGFAAPQSVAVDAAGNVYVADSSNNAIKIMTPNCISSACVTSLGTGFTFNDPRGVAVDGAGNVYIADTQNNAVEMMATNCFSAACVGTLGIGFSQPFGVAVDPVGNLFVADTGNNAIKQMTPGCSNAACITTLGSGISGPQGVAIDGFGNVYVADTNHSLIKQLPFAIPPSFTFASPTVVGITDTSDGAQVADVFNDGNQPLVFVSPTPDASTGFTLGTESTACTQLASATLPVGSTCTLTTNFDPALSQLGSVAGSITLTDNALNIANSTQSIPLSGQALPLVSPTIQSISPNTGLNSGGTTVTITGTNFTDATAVSFLDCGLPSVVSFKVVNPTTILAVTPPDGASASCQALVNVTTPGGTTTYLPFTYFAPLSTTYSSLSSPSPSVAGSQVTVTAKIADAGNLPFSGATVTFSQNVQGSSTQSATASFSNNATATTNAQGIATVTLSDTAAETLAISATISGPTQGTLQPISEQFVAPAYVVSVNTDPATGNGTPSNCVDPNISTSGNANCSLRDAVAAANALTGVTTNISFGGAAVGAAGSPAVIQIAQSTPITITASTNINGPGQNLLSVEGGSTPLSSNNYEIFVQNGGNVHISGLSLINGYASQGGAINFRIGTLTVADSTLSGNLALIGAAIAGGGSGLTLIGSTFANNQGVNLSGGYVNGGAIFDQDPTLTVEGSTFVGNQAVSTQVGGQAAGAAINAQVNTVLNIANSTFTGNIVTANSSTRGGAIQATTINIANSVFVANQSVQSNTDQPVGGAISAFGAVNITGTVFSHNIAELGSAIFFWSEEGTVSDSLNDGGADTFFDAKTVTNLSTGPANLSALGYWGGPTQTFLPLPGSAAICGGTQPLLNGTALTTDQRGVGISGTRYGQVACYDIGAVQTEYALAFTQSPDNALQDNAISPPPIVTVTEDGAALTAGSASVTVSAAAGTLSGTATQSTSTTNGQTSFPGLSIGSAETGDSLTATLALNGSISLSANSSAFDVSPGAVSAANSSLSASPSPAVAGSTVTVTATLKDANSNPVSGATVTFGVTSGTTAVLSNSGVATTDGSGIASVKLTDISAETLTLSATVLGAGSGPLSPTQEQFVAPVYVVSVNTDPATGNGTPSNCVDPNISTSGNTNCSLRDAVAAANALTGVTTNITFASSLTSSATAANPLVVQIAQSGRIATSQSVNVTGPVDANGLNLVTIQGGTVPLSLSNFPVLQVWAGTSSLANLTLSNGTAPLAGGAINQDGGALTLVHCMFSGNLSNTAGGAIFTSGGSLVVTGSTFVNNRDVNTTANSQSLGGAILSVSPLTVEGSTFLGNQADSTGSGRDPSGGAIASLGPLIVVNSTFTGNSASGTSTAYGGAIFAVGLPFNVANSTFVSNQTSASLGQSAGGAIATNAAATVTNTIFSQDAALLGAEVASQGSLALTNDVIDGASNALYGFIASSSVTYKAANLSAVGNWGCPTQTMLPLPGSPAICAGSQPALNGTPLTTDQRGVAISGSRYGQEACYDIGAVQTEYATSFQQEPSNLPVGTAMSPAPTVLVTEDGSALTAGAASLSITDQAGGLVSSPATAMTSTATGFASFSSLNFTRAVTDDTLSATLSLNPNLSPALSLTAQSTAFVVTQSFSPAKSTLSVSSPYSPVGYGDTVTASVRDLNGNPVSGVSVQFTANISGGLPSSTASFTTPAVTGANGQTTVTVTDSVIENLAINALVAGSLFIQTPSVQIIPHVSVLNAAGTYSIVGETLPNAQVSAPSAGSQELALDGSGNAYNVGVGGNALFYDAPDGSVTVAIPAVENGVYKPDALAIDAAGAAWIANSGKPTVSKFVGQPSLAVPLNPINPSLGTTGSANGVSIDVSGNVWVSNATNNTVTEVLGAATPTLPVAASVSAGTAAAKP